MGDIASSVRARLAALRTRETETQAAITSATSLDTFLRIYNKTSVECYKDYMHGAKALRDFLSPIAIPSKEEIPDSALIHIPENLAHTVFDPYHIRQLACILAGSNSLEAYKNPALKRIQKLIVYISVKHLLEG